MTFICAEAANHFSIAGAMKIDWEETSSINKEGHFNLALGLFAFPCFKGKTTIDRADFFCRGFGHHACGVFGAREFRHAIVDAGGRGISVVGVRDFLHLAVALDGSIDIVGFLRQCRR